MHRRIICTLPLFLLMLVIGTAGASGLGRASPENRPTQATVPTLALITPPSLPSFNTTIDVQVTITGATNLAAFEFDLVYDHSQIRVTGVTLSSFLGKTTGCNPNAERCTVALGPRDQTSATSIGAYSYGTGSGASGDSVLAVLHLQPTGAARTIPLQMIGALITDTDATPLAPATQGATLVLPSPIFLPAVRR